MAPSYTTNSGIEKPLDGEQTGSWGDTVNLNMDIIDRSMTGVGTIALSGTTHTLTTTDGTLTDGQYRVLVLGGTPSGTNTITITPNDQTKLYFVSNNSGQSAVFTQGSGGNVTVADGTYKIIYADGAGAGAAVVDFTDKLAASNIDINGGTIDGTVIGGSSAAAGTFTTFTSTGIDDNATSTAVTIDSSGTTTINSGASGATANVTADELVVESSVNGGISILGPNGFYQSLFLGDVADSVSLKVQWDSSNNVGIVGTTKGSAELVLASGNGTEALRIDSSGNVGIGTSSPQNALHVAAADATLRLTTTSDSGQAGIEFWDNQSGTSQAAAIRYYDVTNLFTIQGNANGTIFMTPSNTFPSGSEAMRIDSNGRVGIGTSSPSVALDIESAGWAGLDLNGTSGGDIRLQKNGTTYGNIYASDSTALVLDAANSNEIVFKDSATERMRIDSSGNVGIGTSSPQSIFDITSSSSSSIAIRIQNTEPGVDSITSLSATGSSYSYIGIGSEETALYGRTGIVLAADNPGSGWTPIRFATGGSEQVRIDSSGNVGIGTSSPVAQIHSETASGTLQTRTKVVGTAVSDIAELAIATGSRTYLMQSKGSTGDFVIRDSTGAADRFTIDSTGEATFSGDIVVENGVPVVTVKTTSATGRSDINFADPASSAAGTLSYQHNGDYLQVKVAGTEVTRFDSSGNVGIGTSSPNEPLTVQRSGTAVAGLSPSTVASFQSTSATTQSSYLSIIAGSSGSTAQAAIHFGDADDPDIGQVLYRNADNSMDFVVNASSRMKILSTGRLVIASAAPASDAYIKVPVGSASLGAWASYSGSTSVRKHMYFDNPNGEVGSISTSGSATSFTTSSDYRLKENVTGITDGIERVKQLNPSRFNFISDADTTVDGFLAHEAAAVVPEAVTGEKDEVDADGNPEYQGIDQSKLVPVLTAALQEALTKIEALEARIAALETA